MRHADIISKWPSISAFAADIGSEYGTAKAMRKRSSIPSRYWVTVVSKACDRGIAGVTYEVLAKAAAAEAEVAA
jgi:hypothetical protein